MELTSSRSIACHICTLQDYDMISNGRPNFSNSGTNVFFHLKATSFLKGDTATDLGVVKISFDLLPVYHTVQQSSE